MLPEKETTMATAAAESKTTRDHDEIRKWAEERDGKPARVRGTEKGKGGGAGILRIDFPGGAGQDRLEHISWDEWFETFDERDIDFLYQEQKASGEVSTFFKLVNQGTAEGKK
jgi:hypothetical protein